MPPSIRQKMQAETGFRWQPCSSASNLHPLSALNYDPDQPIILVSSKMTIKIIIILLTILSTPCFSEERDRIRPYTDEKGRVVYTNDHPTPQNNIPNNQNNKAINPFAIDKKMDSTQKPQVFNHPASAQSLPNYNAVEYNILKSFARIVAFQILMVIITTVRLK